MPISTHTLTWSVTVKGLKIGRTSEHFNSHAHVERDKLCHANACVFFISTHTLTWSVTKVAIDNSIFAAISTHTLTWSVTLRFF